jgi:hypothetical protein
MNHDFLEKARMVIFSYDEDRDFLETLTNAYRDVVHTNDMIDRHERSVMNNRETTGIHGSVLASMQGVSNSVSLLQTQLNGKLDKIQKEQKMNPQKKLGGWLRLWIMLSALYLIFVCIFIAKSLPKAENINHSQSIYDQLSPNFRGKLMGSGNSETYRSDKSQLLKEAIRRNHIMVFRSNLPREEMEAVSREYWKIVENLAAKKRTRYIGMAFLWWFVPVVGLYCVGWSIGWVYRGFKKG